MFFNIFKQAEKSSLALKLFKVIFVSYFLVTFGVTVIQLILEYRNTKNQLVTNLEMISQTFSPSVSEAVWSYDEPSLKSIFKGMLKLDDVTGVKVVFRDQVIHSLHESSNEAENMNMMSVIKVFIESMFNQKQYSTTKELVYQDYRGGKHSIGTMIIYSNAYVVFNELKYGFLLIILNSIIKTTALWLIFMVCIHRIVLRPLSKLTETIATFSEHNHGNFEDYLKRKKIYIEHKNQNFDEIQTLAQKFNTLLKSLSVEKEKGFHIEKLQVVEKIAQQVAHDIRSPIAALTVVTQMQENVPEDQRILIRQAVQRIEDIANDLASTKSKFDAKMESSDSKSVTPQMVSGILDLIVSEKRMQYRSRGDLRIDCNINEKSYGLFASIHENTFKRVFSNLINNAVEALGENGHIEVNLLSADQRNLLIQVRDNGKGIPSEILPKLMQRGETHGKSEGKGLGLFHARETIEEWGGSMKLSSKVGRGTSIEIQLPKVSAPDWFLPKICIGSMTRVIVIDDDSSIHQIWTGRFKAPQFKTNEIVHYSSAEAVLRVYDKTPEIFGQDYLVLCDMELRGEEMSGLALLRHVKATDHAVLVTSRFEEPHVRSECKELGIKLIPKNLAGFVPIIVNATMVQPQVGQIDVCVTVAVEEKRERDNARLSPVENTDVILIDDQDMIHKTWQMMAKIKKINLKSFHSADEFFSKCGTLDKNCKVFIDSNLADGVKGEVVAKEIYAKGFVRIYLATGTDRSEFPPMSWITDIVGKQPGF